MVKGNVRIKWAGPNTPVIMLDRNDARLYPTKVELKDLHELLGEFLEAYPEDFTPTTIVHDDTEFEDIDWTDLFDK